MQERQGIIVWVYSLRNLKVLKRHGLMHYVSKRMKYVLLYVNREDVPVTVKTLNDLHFVRKVEVSHRPEIDMNFSERIGKDKYRKEVNEEEFVEVQLETTI